MDSSVEYLSINKDSDVCFIENDILDVFDFLRELEFLYDVW